MTMKYEPRLGDDFRTASLAAIVKATIYNTDVEMMFNETVVKFTKDTTVDQAWSTYNADIEERNRKWRASPEGQAAEQRAQARLRKSQEDHDECMRTLATVLEKGEAAILDWLVKFTDASDHIGVVGKDFARVSSLLELHGYVENDCLDLDKQEYENPNIMARYIVGQAINCMKTLGMGPHPITSKFVADYRKLIAV